jgi:hypothetical protein
VTHIGEYRRGGQPPRQPAACQKEVAFGSARQPVEEEGATDHQQEKRNSPEHIESGEVDHCIPLEK